MNGEIAVGVDGSEASRAALEWAAHRAAATQLPLTLVHVDPDDAASDDETSDGATLLATAVGIAQAIEPDITWTTELLVGDVAAVLAAASERFDLMVVGTHKTGFLRGRALGSRAIQLAANVHCPLAVVPAGTGRRRRSVVLDAATASSSASAAEFSCREAERTGTDLTILHRQTSTENRSVDQAVCEAREGYPTLSIHVRSVLRATAESLLDASVTAQLLVVSASDGGVVGLGAIAHDVLLNITGPTVIIPLGWNAGVRTA